ncbi:peptidylprolyl isomerase [Thermithiobacillus plumbiphilus]|uniref:Peptidyl-prolyl cis-trans isomerase n=1 Tax=Thermithiobacillus plumbiphilus TaxID=1729899 RepID=A0ABU9D7B5_9PROT
MIKNDDVVYISYTLKNQAGEVLEQTGEAIPYLHGHQNIFPKLESCLEGKEPGDQVSVDLLPEEGFGEMREELRRVEPRASFPDDADLRVGSQFEGELPDGEVAVFTVVNVDGQQVFLDGNHPLAGQPLHFDVEVKSVRPASAEELAHGHVHGEGGHHH